MAQAQFTDEKYFPDAITRPDPEDPLYKEFWDACKEGRLVVQACNDCATIQHPPEIICHKCRGYDLGWKDVSGNGKIWTYVIVNRAAHPAMADMIPYNVSLVQMDDEPDFYFLSNVIDVSSEDIEIGLPVTVVFERTEDDLVQPRFRRA